MSSVQPISEPKYGLKKKYENYIGGQWVAPTEGEYFENISPVNGKPMTRVRDRKRRMLNVRSMQRMRQRLRGARRQLPSAALYC